MDRKDISLDQDVHKSDVLIMANRLAYLYYFMAKAIIDEVGEEKAEKIIRKAIHEYGLECGKNVREIVEAQNKELTLENYKLGRDLPTKGWEFTKINTGDPNISVVKTTYCPLAEKWKELDFAKWGRLYCFVDQGKYEGYDTSYKCYHDKNVLDGDECCIIRVEKSK